jgi:hypothetical protein
MSAAHKIYMSTLAETKMALHSVKHGFSNPIHGIVLGKKSDDDNADLLEIVDVIPVCHEVPTKPIVDMALRLADAHLQQQRGAEKNNLTIIGWYTSNASTSYDETPNLSACRVASSMSSSDNGEEGGNFILVLVTTSGILAAVSKDSSDSSLSPLCRVFQKDVKTKTFSQEVDSALVLQENETSYIISKAMLKEMPIYDFAEHISNFGSDEWSKMDWITNSAIKL